jgi:sulfatase modifying factor 1
LSLLAPAAMAQERSLQAQAGVRALPPSDKRWALLIGVDEYEDGNIGRLVGAANDARALKRVLVRSAGFPEDQVVVLATGDGRGSEPTRSNILERLSTVTRLAPKDGLLLFAFSGHGIDRKGRAFLLPSDARMNDDPNLLEDLSVSVDRVRQRIEYAGLQQVLVLLDACRNDPGGRSTTPNPLTEAFTRGFQFDVRNREVSAFATVYATKVGERAWEDQKNKRGYFSQAVEAALSGRAANERGEVTLAAMVSYLQIQVPKQVALALGPDRRQLPFARVEGYKADELVLAVTQPTVAPASGCTETARESWSAVKDSTSALLLDRYAAQFPSCELATVAKFKADAIRESVTRPIAPETGEPKVRVNPKDGQKYVWIPPGTFQMGCSPGDGECYFDEKPAHRVTISKGLWMGQTEVTQEAYQRVLGRHLSWFKGERLPVESVTWSDAKEYCGEVGGRLPTEAEWEYAARAGGAVARYGDLDAIAWYSTNTGSKTHEVGGKQANAWGLYDMLGSVYEWTGDWYGEKYYENGEKVDPQGPPGGQYRAVRGGSWGTSPTYARVSGRDRFEPGARYVVVGFRCAGELP